MCYEWEKYGWGLSQQRQQPVPWSWTKYDASHRDTQAGCVASSGIGGTRSFGCRDAIYNPLTRLAIALLKLSRCSLEEASSTIRPNATNRTAFSQRLFKSIFGSSPR